ncbi:MAG: Transcriptional regulator, AcrR family [uncultured Thermomicrobiales bacterium]|uniref:Transcriptional regulator, AcrR family n=1 Tax=uncultured Thermomicrobiales bacterium TaxID=1645740 RepID=A0A6J4VKD6_9BACT|nr:MAG: Transcriptional regulator, AcrR family [uncultured Thermomicrobiales bacterium]
MGIVERKERQRRAVGEGILAAAREIASGEGWRSVTIRKIAGRIEYSPPVIYEHFGSKDEILLELMRMGYAEQLEAVEAAARAASGPKEALLGMARAWLDFAVGAPDLYQVMYSLGGAALPAAAAQEEGLKIADAVGKVIEAILRRHGREPDDILGKVTLLWATMHGLVALLMAGRIAGGREEAARLVEEAARDALVAWRSG